AAGFFCCQADDGIRARNVTGVQTCALPISLGAPADTQSGKATSLTIIWRQGQRAPSDRDHADRRECALSAHQGRTHGTRSVRLGPIGSGSAGRRGTPTGGKPNMSKTGAPRLAVDAGGARIVIVASQWHETVMDGLIAGAMRALETARVADVSVVRVPGSFE